MSRWWALAPPIAVVLLVLFVHVVWLMGKQ